MEYVLNLAHFSVVERAQTDLKSVGKRYTTNHRT